MHQVMVLVVLASSAAGVSETWMKLLFTYGPFALLTLFVFVILGKAKSQMNDTAKKNPVRVLVYSGTWVAIFVLCGIIVWVWIRLNVPSEEFTIRGHLTGLQDDEKFASRFADMFLKRLSYEQHRNFDYEWRIITRDKLPDAQSISLLIDRSTKEHEDLVEYVLPIRSDFYVANAIVDLKYNRQGRKLELFQGGEFTPLKVTWSSDTGETQGALQEPAGGSVGFLNLVTTVFAQSPMNSETLGRRLESDDPVMRLDARAELAKAGLDALPYIRDVLENRNSSYRLRLGVISALNNIKEVSASSLGPAGGCAIKTASRDSDSAIRTEAKRFLGAHRDVDAETCRTVIKPIIEGFGVGSDRIQEGQKVKLFWFTQNATDISIAPEIGSVGPNGARDVKPSKTTAYTLTARGQGGVDTRTAQVIVEARVLPSPQPPQPEPPQPRAEDPEVKAIRDLFAQYKDAYDTMDIGELKQVWPSIPKDTEKALRVTFKNAKTIKVHLKCDDPVIQGNLAQSNCTESLVYTMDNQQKPTSTVSISFHLHKANGAWHIVGVR